MSRVKKQRGFTADDDEWDLITRASKNAGYTTVTSYMREHMLKQARKDIKRCIKKES